MFVEDEAMVNHKFSISSTPSPIPINLYDISKAQLK